MSEDTQFIQINRVDEVSLVYEISEGMIDNENNLRVVLTGGDTVCVNRYSWTAYRISDTEPKGVGDGARLVDGLSG